MDDGRLLACFVDVLQDGALRSFFQPIVDLEKGDVIGYEALIRGPADSLLFTPDVLFDLASRSGRTFELERQCRRLHTERFAELGLAGRLFLNISPDALLHPAHGMDLRQGGGGPDVMARTVIELTESATPNSYEHLRQAAADYRGYGFQIAIDDLGAGFSSLRLWSELRPEFVKIDKYFIRGLEADPVKRQFVRSILEIARQSGARVIAEGIETRAELEAAISVGITCGQGFFLGRPCATPPADIDPVARQVMDGLSRKRGQTQQGPASQRSVRKILRMVPTVEHLMPINAVYDVFKAQPELPVLVVLQNGTPIGLINRLRMLERLARPYHRELYGAKPCAHFIEHAPLVVDHGTSLHDLGHLMTESNPHHLTDGFIITEQARCIGVGTGQDLIREITQMQLNAARYANPLTQLPGNVPINEHIESLLQSGEAFSVCHCDLDNFKPFNDLYGYRKGDEVIQLTANLLCDCTDADRDFVGHVGGDDFIIVFRSDDWRTRCETILQRFPATTVRLYSEADLQAGGYVTRNRQGLPVFHDLVTLSLGVAPIPAASGLSSYHVAELAVGAKSQAKKMTGNALFVERRGGIATAASGLSG